MPYPNFHAARVRNPDLFARIRVLKTLPNGIMIYGGALKSDPQGSGKPQAYRFPKKSFTVAQAKEWLKEHNIKVILFEEASKQVQTFSDNVILYSYRIVAFQNEILAMIPSDILRKIKEKDPHPYFQMYSLCHEGMSQPKILGESNNKPIFWPRKAIQSLKNIILKGIKLFKGHNEDNSVANRETIGEVIHSFEKEKDGKLHHMIITYHTPKQMEEAKKFDVCSQEGIWNFIDSAGKLIADSIVKVTGIAGGNSKFDKPAFSGAKRLGFVQAFKTGDNMNVFRENIEETITEKTKQISFPQWKEMAKSFSVYPWQLFNLDDLKTDREFGKYFKELEDLKNENEKLKKQYEDDIGKLNSEINGYKRKNYENSAKKRLDTLIEEENLTDKMKIFVEKAFERDKNKIEDLSDEGLKGFVENQKQNFQNVMSIIDIEIPNSPEKKENEQSQDDFSKAEQNEFLTEDVNFEELE